MGSTGPINTWKMVQNDVEVATHVGEGGLILVPERREMAVELQCQHQIRPTSSARLREATALHLDMRTLSQRTAGETAKPGPESCVLQRAPGGVEEDGDDDVAVVAHRRIDELAIRPTAHLASL